SPPPRERWAPPPRLGFATQPPDDRTDHGSEHAERADQRDEPPPPQAGIGRWSVAGREVQRRPRTHEGDEHLRPRLAAHTAHRRDRDCGPEHGQPTVVRPLESTEADRTVVRPWQPGADDRDDDRYRQQPGPRAQQRPPLLRGALPPVTFRRQLVVGDWRDVRLVGFLVHVALIAPFWGRRLRHEAQFLSCWLR